MKTIYNTYIEVTSHEQLDRINQMCIDNGLFNTIFQKIISIDFNKLYFEYFNGIFFISTINFNPYKVTEEEFLKLLQDERVRQNNN